jgi:hypothetical protein
MHRITRTFTALVLSGGLVMAGCGDDDDEVDTEPGQESTSTIAEEDMTDDTTEDMTDDTTEDMTDDTTEDMTDDMSETTG